VAASAAGVGAHSGTQSASETPPNRIAWPCRVRTARRAVRRSHDRGAAQRSESQSEQLMSSGS
jgi:hypothetical protein